MKTKGENRRWQEAGIDTEDLREFLPVNELLVPAEVKLKNEQLHWSGKEGKFESVRVPNTLLNSFISLGKADTKKIYMFAKKWGPLGLCQHGLPRTHSWGTTFQYGRNERNQRNTCQSLNTEPIDSWRRWSEKFRAVLNVTANVYAGRHGKIGDWRLIFEDTGWWNEEHYLGWGEEGEDESLIYDGYWVSEVTTPERMWLMDIVNNYLDMGRVGPRILLIGNNYEDIPTRVFFAGEFSSSLFGVLAFQLMIAVSGTNVPAICSACGMTYFPKRRPKAGQSNYCHRKSCGHKAAVRDASRRFRQNNPDYYRERRRKQKNQS